MTLNTPTPFHALHTGPQALVLPNAWDAASAALFQRAGAPAVATSSAALAWSLGYPDGGALPRQELLSAIRRMLRVLDIPLSVDLEDGYGDAAEAVTTLVAEVANMGVAGINLEDGTKEPQLLAGKIAASRQALGNTPLFINARTDVYLRGLASGSDAVAMTLERARVYRAAGADGLFVPGLSTTEDATALSDAIAMPLNLMLLPGMPSIPTLFAAGARRFTAGPANFLTAYSNVHSIAQELLAEHRVSGLFAQTVSFDSMNALFS